MQNRTEKLPWFASVMYHRVVESVIGPDPYHLSISVDDLDSQLRYLKDKGYRSVDAQTALDDAVSNPEQSRRNVVLTFDDGYLDFMTHALPLLNKHGFTATMMLISDRIGGTNVWDEGKAEQVPLMSVADIREARAAGISFGSHSKTHPPLGRIDEEEARSEVIDSKSALEDILGEPVKIFTFPYGSYNAPVQDAVADAGYEAAFSIEDRRHSRFNMTRVDGVKANGVGFNWRLRINGRHYRLRNRAAGFKQTLRKLKP